MGNQGRGLWSRFESLVEIISGATGFLGGVAILAAALIVTEGVVVRKIFGLSTIFQIELSVFLLIYAAFVGAAQTQKKEHHLNVDLIIVHLSPKAREILLLAVSIFSCLLCALMAYYAWPMWWEALINKEHSESLWGPPLWIPYVFLPLGMTTLFLQSLVQIIRKIGKLRAGTVEAAVTRVELKDVDVPQDHKPDGEQEQHHG